MPSVRIKPELEMHYRHDDFADPWRPRDTIVFLHGLAESGLSWFGWVPHFARTFATLRPDMRGFGQSTAMDENHRWSLDELVDDFVRLTEHLGIERFHLVGAKFGGSIAMHFAATRPEKIRTLTIAGSPVTGGGMFKQLPAWLETVRREGLESFARSSMGARLGSNYPEEAREWWIRLMSSSSTAGLFGALSILPTMDLRPDLRNIKAPTLIITTSGSALGSVDEVRDWQRLIPRSELVVIPGDSYHVAATNPDQAAEATLGFLARCQA